jgi:hypothetical protein
MIFLTDADLDQTIKADHLLQVLDGDAAAKDEAEKTAIAQVEDYLSEIYNTNAIFAATGNNRHKSIIRIVMALMLYHLHKRIDPTMIPEIRRIEYEDVLAELQKIHDGRISPKGLPLIDEDGDGEADAGHWRLGDKGRFNSDY